MWADIEMRAAITALRRIGREHLPETVALALNYTAQGVTRQARENVKSRLTVRTQYTLNSLTSRKAKPFEALGSAFGTDIERMRSRAGTISPYLAVQNEGGEVRGEGRRYPIPTVAVRRGRSMEGRVQRKYAMDRIGDVGSVQAPGGYNRYFIGKPKGSNRPLGLYRRHDNNNRLMMIRNLSESSVRVPATHWFDDAVKTEGRPADIQRHFMAAARQKLGRYGVQAGR
jgi:hypothetical protein